MSYLRRRGGIREVYLWFIYHYVSGFLLFGGKTIEKRAAVKDASKKIKRDKRGYTSAVVLDLVFDGRDRRWIVRNLVHFLEKIVEDLSLHLGIMV